MTQSLPFLLLRLRDHAKNMRKADARKFRTQCHMLAGLLRQLMDLYEQSGSLRHMPEHTMVADAIGQFYFQTLVLIKPRDHSQVYLGSQDLELEMRMLRGAFAAAGLSYEDKGIKEMLLDACANMEAAAEELRANGFHAYQQMELKRLQLPAPAPTAVPVKPPSNVVNLKMFRLTRSK